MTILQHFYSRLGYLKVFESGAFKWELFYFYSKPKVMHALVWLKSDLLFSFKIKKSTKILEKLSCLDLLCWMEQFIFKCTGRRIQAFE